MEDFDIKVAALLKHFDLELTEENAETVSECGYGNETFEIESEPGEYRILTASEREDAVDEALENYIDECIMPECPEPVRSYFDRDAWKRDALISDGYGHTLSGYDGEEHEYQIDGGWLYIYRVN